VTKAELRGAGRGGGHSEMPDTLQLTAAAMIEDLEALPRAFPHAERPDAFFPAVERFLASGSAEAHGGEGDDGHRADKIPLESDSNSAVDE
jgi:hypothetical protein